MYSINGQSVVLIPAALCDRQRVYDWCFHSETTKSHSGPPDYPEAPIATPGEFFQENGGYEEYFFTGARPRDGRGFIIHKGGEAVGFVSYTSFHLKPRVAELDIWMNSEAHCGKGYGTDALLALSARLHESLGMKSLIMRPSAKNARAVRAYNKAGFHKTEQPIGDFMPEEYLPAFAAGDYGPGGDVLLVKYM
ncbi:MAG: GNAT family N-acetyltransferase [Oscillospiraceae bacterium]|nr:GNAT family N-acetyltransferase [Oscillospiraceae bacterium]